jgi:hypothetical protein
MAIHAKLSRSSLLFCGFAAIGMTAAEIVRRRADANQSNMGLTAWTGGRVLKRDVPTAKNYFDEKENSHPPARDRRRGHAAASRDGTSGFSRVSGAVTPGGSGA